MFRKIGIVSRLDREDAVKLAGEVGSFIRGRGLTPVFEAELATRLGEVGVPLSRMEGNLVVIIGGDGTVLRTVHGVARRIPLLTVNMGLVAFFADVPPDDALPALGRVLDGKFIRDSCFMLSTNLDIPHALNEVRVGSEVPQQMIEMSLSVDGVKIAKDKVDAILIATSVGASAYALSAGVNVIDPRVEAIVIVPICPLSSNFKPYIVPSNVEVSVKPESRMEFVVLVDGQVQKKFDHPLEIKVRKSDDAVTFLRTEQNFYKRLRRRLRTSSVDF